MLLFVNNRGRDDTDVATGLNLGVDSSWCWSKNMCNPKRASREPRRVLPPFNGAHLESAGIVTNAKQIWDCYELLPVGTFSFSSIKEDEMTPMLSPP